MSDAKIFQSIDGFYEVCNELETIPEDQKIAQFTSFINFLSGLLV